jgi:hypothetical protein
VAADGGRSANVARATGRRVELVRRSHVWVGLVTAVGVIAISLTGIALNHRDLLGIGREGPPAVEGSGEIGEAVPINDLLRRALIAADAAGIRIEGRNGRELHPNGPGDIDRAMFRPSTRTVQVRLDDPRATEVILDWSTGDVLGLSARDDVRIEHIHSGEVIGQKGVVVSDILAVVLVGLTVGGLLIWLRRLRRERAGLTAGRSKMSWWLRLNWRFHLVASILAAVYIVVLSITGVLLNHKREWGLMVEPVKIIEPESVARRTPESLDQVVRWGLAERQRVTPDATFDDIRFIDYRPLNGYAKLRFQDEREVIVDVYEGRILSQADRLDVWVEHLHSGLLFGDDWVLLSDAAGVLLILLSLNGLYLFALPGWRLRGLARPSERA